MPSFDVVSEVNLQEIDNAVNQARKEVTGRYDFRGSKSSIEWDKKVIELVGDDDYKMSAMKDILLKKIHHRGVDITALKFEEPIQAGGMLIKQKITLVQGIEKEIAKKMTKDIKDSKLKVQAQIQDEQLRVTSKSIDELQSCISFLRGKTYGIPLQFINMRS